METTDGGGPFGNVGGLGTIISTGGMQNDYLIVVNFSGGEHTGNKKIEIGMVVPCNLTSEHSDQDLSLTDGDFGKLYSISYVANKPRLPYYETHSPQGYGYATIVEIDIFSNPRAVKVELNGYPPFDKQYIDVTKVVLGHYPKKTNVNTDMDYQIPHYVTNNGDGDPNKLYFYDYPAGKSLDIGRPCIVLYDSSQQVKAVLVWEHPN